MGLSHWTHYALMFGLLAALFLPLWWLRWRAWQRQRFSSTTARSTSLTLAGPHSGPYSHYSTPAEPETSRRETERAQDTAKARMIPMQSDGSCTFMDSHGCCGLPNALRRVARRS